MRYRVVVNHRFADDEGHPYLWVAPSASIMRLDSVSSAVLDAFDGEGADAAAWEESLGDQSDRGEELRGVFRDLVDLGVVRPEGEVSPPATELPPMPYPLATLVLNVTNKCNLSCTYCYEFGADRVVEDTGRAPLMDPATARKSVDLLFRTSASRPGVALTFFGGETLLNFSTIEVAVSHATELAREHNKRVSFALTTNATLLTDGIINFLVKHRFGINISIDGAAAEQNRHRTLRSGKGSFEVIEPRIRKLIDANRAGGGRPIGARVTMTRGAADALSTYRYLVDELGFGGVGFAPVTSSKERDWSLVESDYDQLLGDFSRLAEDYVEAAVRGNHHGFSNLDDLLRELHQGTNKAHPCGAGLGLLGVSTEGKLALCHRFVESDTHEVGNLDDGVDEEVRAEFLRTTHVSHKADCNTCFARPHCAGGCYHEAYVRYGDVRKANVHYCDWVRSWTDLGLTTYARIANRNPAYFAKFDSP